MTVTLDGYTITMRGGEFAENVIQVGAEYDAWVSSEYHRKVFAYGMLRGWVFTCFEATDTIPWPASPAYHFQIHVEDGAEVRFDLGYADHAFSGDVYIKSVRVWYDSNMSVRYYEIEVREA